MASTEKIEAFLAERRNVVVAGIRRDGRPHLSPNWFYWDGQRFYVSTTRDRVKYAIFRRDPRAQLLIDDPTGFRAVLVPATVQIRDDIAAELPRFRYPSDVAVPAPGCWSFTLQGSGPEPGPTRYSGGPGHLACLARLGVQALEPDRDSSGFSGSTTSPALSAPK
jgi:PPOX class probable F420-dependent enzyme